MSEQSPNIGDIHANIQDALSLLPMQELQTARTYLDTARAALRGIMRDEQSSSPLYDIMLLTKKAIIKNDTAAIGCVNTRTELNAYIGTLVNGDTTDPPPTVMPYTFPYAAELVTNTPAAEEGNARAHELKQLIDPAGTLPIITLHLCPQLTSDATGERRWDVMHNGEKVGMCNVRQNHADRHYYFFGVYTEKRGAGLGMATYLAVIQDAVRCGYGFRTDPTSQTLDSKKIWDRLVDCGAARVIKPFKKYNKDKYRGYYQIDAASGDSKQT